MGSSLRSPERGRVQGGFELWNDIPSEALEYEGSGSQPSCLALAHLPAKVATPQFVLIRIPHSFFK